VLRVVGVGAETVWRGERETMEVEEEVEEVEREGDGLNVFPPLAVTAGDLELEGEGDAVKVAKDVRDTRVVSEAVIEVSEDLDSLCLGDTVD
jgi:hypothetical protein